MFIAIIEKASRRVLEIVTNEAASLEAMQAYNGAATRCLCSEKEFRAYSEGKEISAPTSYAITTDDYGREYNTLKTTFAF